MTGARAQFGRRPSVSPAVVEPPTVYPAVVEPPSVEAPVAGRRAARRRVSAGRQGRRGGLALPALALAVVALTWVDAGVLRAEDAAVEPHPPSTAIDAENVAQPRRLGAVASATDSAAEPDDAAATDEIEREQEDDA